MIYNRIAGRPQYLERSVVIGLSDNKGEPTTVTVEGQEYSFDHSLPRDDP